jgi:hypothetical protein
MNKNEVEILENESGTSKCFGLKEERMEPTWEAHSKV